MYWDTIGHVALIVLGTAYVLEMVGVWRRHIPCQHLHRYQVSFPNTRLVECCHDCGQSRLIWVYPSCLYSTWKKVTTSHLTSCRSCCTPSW